MTVRCLDLPEQHNTLPPDRAQTRITDNDNVHLTKESFKEAGNSFQHFSNSCSLKDEHYHSLTF